LVISQNINYLVNKYSQKLNNLTSLQPEDDASAMLQRITVPPFSRWSIPVLGCASRSRWRHYAPSKFQCLFTVTLQYMPEDLHIHQHWCHNLKFTWLQSICVLTPI